MVDKHLIFSLCMAKVTQTLCAPMFLLKHVVTHPIPITKVLLRDLQILAGSQNYLQVQIFLPPC